MKILAALVLISLILPNTVTAKEPFEKDVIKTSAGDLEITFIGHGTLMMTFGGKTIHVDPFGQMADYRELPKAQMVFITHGHSDHLDPIVLEKIRTEKTAVVCTQSCLDKIENGIVMKNGDVKTVNGIEVEAVPAYNLVHKRNDGQFFHPKGEGNGYVLTFGDKRVYIAGDTENTPEMKALKSIDYAFLPMNLPYTMTPEMVADAVKAFKPKVLYPYHYGETDTAKIVELLEDSKDTKVRIRKMK